MGDTKHNQEVLETRWLKNLSKLTTIRIERDVLDHDNFKFEVILFLSESDRFNLRVTSAEENM